MQEYLEKKDFFSLHLGEDQPSQKYLFIDHFILKIIACIVMTIDHIGLFFIPQGWPLYEVFRILGRLAFPLFAFLTYEGTLRSKNSYLYSLKLMVLGGIMYLVVFLITKQNISNALLTLGLCALISSLVNQQNKFSFLAIIPATIIILSDFPFFPFYCEYGTYGLLMYIGFMVARYLTLFHEKRLAENSGLDPDVVYSINGRLIQNIYSAGMLLIVNMIMLVFYKLYGVTNPLFANFSIPFAYMQYSALAGLILIFYSGRKGISNKYLTCTFYLYYPLHVVIFYLIFYFGMGGIVSVLLF